MRKNKSGNLIFLIFLTFLLFPTVGQSQELRRNTNSPLLDGRIQSGEYGYQKDFGNFQIYLGWNGNKLFAAVSTGTIAWVAMGFGSTRMDNAKMLIGYLRDGKAVLRTDLGRGHSHGSIPEQLAVNYALDQSAGKTILEVELDETDILGAGDDNLKMICAVGSSNNFPSRHQYRIGLQVPIKRN